VLRGRWLTVLGAAAAGAYVAYRTRPHLRERDRPVREIRAYPPPQTEPTARFEPVPFAPQSPAEGVAMVVPMDATPAAPLVAPVERNGSPVVTAEPTPSRASPAGVLGQPVQLPPKPRLSGPVLAAVAALAGVAAIALGATAFAATVDSGSGESSQPAAAADQGTISLLAKPSTQRIPIANSGGRIILAVGTAGRAVLVLDGLGLAPEGKSYQAWVIQPNAQAPTSAGVFAGTERIVPLSVSLRPGSVVAITVEQAGGVPAPTQTPKLVGQPST
jgi:Anti-sigma-K factor rskA, C-terminal